MIVLFLGLSLLLDVGLVVVVNENTGVDGLA